MRNVIAAFLLFVCVGSGHALTLSNLITNARVLTRDASSSTRQRFTDSQITEFLNQGQRQAISATNCIMASTSFQLSPGTTYYPLPSNFNSIARVTRNKYGAMLELSPAALDARSRGWETASGSPTYYFVNFSSRGLVGFATFPQTAADTDTVKVDYYANANELVNNTDVPFNGIGELSEYQYALTYYAAAIMSAIDGLQSQSQGFMSVYTAEVATMKKNCMDRPNYLPSSSSSP